MTQIIFWWGVGIALYLMSFRNASGSLRRDAHLGTVINTYFTKANERKDLLQIYELFVLERKYKHL